MNRYYTSLIAHYHRTHANPADILFDAQTISRSSDILALFQSAYQKADDETRIFVHFYNYLWKPLLGHGNNNWLTVHDVNNLLGLADFKIISHERFILLPWHIPVLSWFMNKILAYIPLVNRLCLVHSVIARKVPKDHKDMSVSFIIPVRNEAGNLKALITQVPLFGNSQELLFIEGHSKDTSWQELVRLKSLYKEKTIRLFRQKGIGKADAVRLGFRKATGEICIILDADLSVNPKDTKKFYDAIVQGYGEFINGSRLVYPVEKEAMRFLNILGNQFFSVILSWIINQPIKDTLCGTKAITKKNYALIAKNRKYFGDFDPFGDFDLIFGSAKRNLHIVEVPVRYHARTYGSTNISRFTHGLLLLRMTIFALTKFKFL